MDMFNLRLPLVHCSTFSSSDMEFRSSLSIYPFSYWRHSAATENCKGLNVWDTNMGWVGVGMTSFENQRVPKCTWHPSAGAYSSSSTSLRCNFDIVSQHIYIRFSFYPFAPNFSACMIMKCWHMIQNNRPLSQALLHWLRVYPLRPLSLSFFRMKFTVSCVDPIGTEQYAVARPAASQGNRLVQVPYAVSFMREWRVNGAVPSWFLRW